MPDPYKDPYKAYLDATVLAQTVSPEADDFEQLQQAAATARTELANAIREGKEATSDVEPGPEPDESPEGFNPGDHTVDEVRAFLQDFPEQTERVLEAEAEGKNRVGILGE